MENITSDKILSELEPNWKKFSPYMIEKLYDLDKEFYIKTRWDTVYVGSVYWKQGHGNNYYFGTAFNEDGHKVYPEDVVSIQVKGTPDGE